ncbi:hypothetical protein L9F63_012305, partial [Diploptera punctata]
RDKIRKSDDVIHHKSRHRKNISLNINTEFTGFCLDCILNCSIYLTMGQPRSPGIQCNEMKKKT